MGAASLGERLSKFIREVLCFFLFLFFVFSPSLMAKVWTIGNEK